MELKCSSLVIITLFSAQLICNVQSVIRSEDRELLSRVKRQLNVLQGSGVQNAVLNFPVPVNIDHYTGVNQVIDNCPRDKVAVQGYGKKCEKLLSRGSCKIDEVVIINPDNNMGFCAPRLCPPDRIFVHATQLCHDPQDTSVCPASRELFSTAYGTAICDCPVGTVESSNRLYGDVCEPILSESHLCQKGQVVWFKDFNSPPQCLPDPCHGKNLQRLPGSLPFVPSQNNGECHQLGQTSGVCLPGLIYALHLPTLRGVCETLENLGYDQFNQEDLAFLNRMYGITVVKNNAIADTLGQNEIFGTGSVGSHNQGQSFFHGHSQPHQQSPHQQQIHFQPQVHFQEQSQSYSREQSLSSNHILSDYRSEYLRALGFRESGIPAVLVALVSTQPSGEAVAHVHPYSRSIRSLNITDEDENINDDQSKFDEEENANVNGTETSQPRDKRQGRPAGKQLQSYNSAGNVFESPLMSCSPGSSRDLNAKCRETILPGSSPKTRRAAPAPPVPPTPTCPGGAFNAQRMCTSRGSAQSSRAASALG